MCIVVCHHLFAYWFVRGTVQDGTFYVWMLVNLHQVFILVLGWIDRLAFESTYDGIRGGGRPGLPLPAGGPPGPGRFGIAGAGRCPAGTGGGARALGTVGWLVGRRCPPGDGGDILNQQIILFIKFVNQHFFQLHFFLFLLTQSCFPPKASKKRKQRNVTIEFNF